MAELDKKLSTSHASPVQGHVLLNLQKLDDHYFVTFSDQFPMGEANASLEKALTKIFAQNHHLNFEVLVPVRAVRETIARAQQNKDAIVRVQINIYGQQHMASSVGAELSSHKIYLQRPYYVDPSSVYNNPQELKFENSDLLVFENTGTVEESATANIAEASLKDTISDVYSALTRDRTLKTLETDDRLRTPLLL